MNASLANLWRTGPDIGASYEQAIDRAMISNTVNGYIFPAAAVGFLWLCGVKCSTCVVL